MRVIGLIILFFFFVLVTSCNGNSKSKLLYGTWYVDDLPAEMIMKFTFSEKKVMYIYTSLEKAELLDSMNFKLNTNETKILTTEGNKKGALDIINLTEKKLTLRINGKDLYLKKK